MASTDRNSPEGTKTVYPSFYWSLWHLHRRNPALLEVDLVDIEIEEASAIKVKMRAENFILIFGAVGKRMKLLSKSKIGARIYDPHQCEVPDALFNKCCQRAAAIMHDHESRIRVVEKDVQLELRF